MRIDGFDNALMERFPRVSRKYRNIVRLCFSLQPLPIEMTCLFERGRNDFRYSNPALT